MATNAGAFVQYTRSMVPNASSVEIDWNNRLFESQDSNSVTVLSRYASTAVKGAKNLVFLEYDNQGLSTQLDTSVIGGLTQLLYKYCTAHLWFKEILVRSSHILEHLSILYMPQTCIDDILLTSAGTPIVYPALRKLYLDPIVESLVSNEFSKELANSSTTHFPVLKELRIIGPYPFSSNVFTRCPNTTIESLHIAITPTFIQQQGLFMAIASSQFISLKTLVIVNRLMEDDDTALQFIKTTTKMSTTLHSFEFSGFLDSGLLLKSMSAFSMSVTLRFIRIRNVEVEFSDLILLLKHFPLLCTADIMLNGNIPAIDGINSKDLADYIGRVIYPLNINFNMLCLRNIQPMEPEYLGETIALLAIGCPRMARCATGNQNKELLEQKIRTLASSNSYFEYSKRLLMVKISP